MKITYKGDYALKTVLELALHDGNTIRTINELAKCADIPIKFLEQILLDLKRGGFVKSKRGKVGGYFLAKPPEKVCLGEVIRFIDGPLEPVACVDKHYKDCRDTKKCVFRNIWQRISKVTSGIVDSITFADLVKMYREKNKSSINMYYI